MRAVLFAVLALLTLTPAAGAQGGTGPYVDISTGASGIPLLGAVTAIAVGPGRVLYAAGAFVVGQQTYREYSVARWTGTEWVQVGRISGSPFLQIHALAFASDGSLYVGGRFESVDGVAARNVARWDGQRWYPTGGGLGLPGLISEVFALAIDRYGVVYAGGEFYLPDTYGPDAVARLDDSGWAAAGEHISGTAYALAFGSNGTLYAGGRSLRVAGTYPGANVLGYDGTWKTFDGPGAPTSPVRALLAHPGGVVYAGGDPAYSPVTDSARVARLDGSDWSRFGNGFDVPIHALAVDAAGRLVAGTGSDYGYYGPSCCLSAWDGRAWVPVGGGTNSTVLALASRLADGENGEALYAGGYFSATGDVPARSVAAWNGRTWRAFGSSTDVSISVVAWGPDGSLYAGGSFTTIGSLKTRGIARWTGAAWEPLGLGVGGYGYVGSLLFGPDGSLYAGGRFTSIGGIAAQGVARWDGTRWHALGAGPSTAPDKDVRDMAFGPDGKLYAVGLFYPGNRALFRWDGTTWEAAGRGAAVSNGGNDYGLDALAFGTDGSLYVGGSFTTIDGVAARHVARWAGTAWNPLGVGLTRDGSAGPPLSVLDLAVAPDGALVVGGSFLFAGGHPAPNIARWDGAAWSAYATGLNDTVFSIDLRPDGRFVVGGRFTATGDGSPGQVALWDGSRFRTLPDGIHNDVYAVASNASGALAIAGAFLTAGNAVTPHITRYDLSGMVGSEAGPVATDIATGLSVAPNPARRATALTATHPAGPVTLDVFDALGRRVARVFDGEAAAGVQRLTVDTSGLAPGVYVVRLTAGGRVTSARLSVVR